MKIDKNNAWMLGITGIILFVILPSFGIVIFSTNASALQTFSVSNSDCSFTTNINPTSINDYNNPGAKIMLNGKGYSWIAVHGWACDSPNYGDPSTGPWKIDSVKAIGGYEIRGFGSQIVICNNEKSVNFQEDDTQLTCDTSNQNNNNNQDSNNNNQTNNTNQNPTSNILTMTIYTFGTFQLKLWMVLIAVVLIIVIASKK